MADRKEKRHIPGSFPVVVSVRVVKEHLKAILVSDGSIEAWLPKSQITFLTRYNERRETTIGMPKWLAKEKGFLV